MRILTDLGHPKNIHVLKNLILPLGQKGHEIHFVYREREHIKELCGAFGISGMNRGKGGTGLLNKFFYLLKTDYQLYRLARKIKPDLLLSFASPYLAHLARMTGVPMIVFDDTEANRLVQKIYAQTAAAIVVPACFGKELSARQSRFDGYFELAYLHPQYFTPDADIRREMGLNSGERFVLLRTVAWQALHDRRHRGLSAAELADLCHAYSGLARVFISAEGELPRRFEPLRLKTASERIHHVIASSALVFSEGATMAAEAAVLGVPTVHCSDLRPGYIADLETRHGLLRSFFHNDFQAALIAGTEFLKDHGGFRQNLTMRKEKMLQESEDVIQLMVERIDRFGKQPGMTG